MGDPTAKRNEKESYKVQTDAKAPLEKTPEFSKNLTENGKSTDESKTPSEKSEEAEKSVQEKEKSEEELIQETLIVDINTSSYDELVFWCRRLGLEHSGSKSALQDRLKKLYGVSGNQTAVKESKEANEIFIESAQKSSYYKIEEIDEDYIRIVGNVAVILEEKESKGKSSHKVTSDYIIFNKKQKLMSAYGHVLYEKKSGNNSEFFTGDSLIFNIDSWEGVIYKGVSQKKKESSSDNKKSKRSEEANSNTFYYSGDKLIKGKDDKIKMINGKISSSEGDFPVYSIKANNIWVLAPGEWGIKGATIQVGEVPLLWLPFFVKWGDHFVFNPAVGKSDDIGSYLNTTYYFLGKKEKEDSSDSFNFMDPGSGDTEEKWQEGLFLRNGTNPKKENEKEANSKEDLPTETENEKKEESEADKRHRLRKENHQKQWEKMVSNENTYLKLMVDAYSNVGQYIGLSGKLAGIENIQDLEFHSGIGLSYYGVNFGKGSIANGMEIQKKTKMINKEKGLLEENLIDYYGMVVDHSYFFGYLVPFRYGIKAKVAYNNSAYYWNTRLEMVLYSDSQYEDHFLKYRQENFNFEQALGLKEDEPIYNKTDKISKLNWYWENSFSSLNRLLPKEVSPYISDLAINQLNFRFDFLQDTFKDTLLNYRGEQKKPATVVKEYFVPSQLVLPEIHFTMKGSLFNTSYDYNGVRTSSTNKSTDKKNGASQKIEEFRSPWEDQEKEKVEKSVGELKSDPFFPDVKVKKLSISRLFEHQLNYEFKNFSLQLIGKFLHATPPTPDQFHQIGINPTKEKENFIINFQLSSALLKLKGDSEFQYRASFFDNRVTLSDSLRFNGNYQNTFYINEMLDRDLKNTPVEKNNATERNEGVEDELARSVARLSDYQNSNIKISNSFSITVNPFREIKELNGSSLSYTLNNTLLNYYYVASSKKYQILAGEWDNNNVSVHQLKGNLQFKILEQDQSFSLDFLLPPKEVSITPKLNTKIGLFSNSLSFSLLKAFANKGIFDSSYNQGTYNKTMTHSRDIDIEDQLNNGLSNWYVRDVNNNAVFTLGNGISLQNNLQYGILENRLKSMTTVFNANLYKNNIVFNQNLRITEENGIILPDLASFGLKLWFFNINFNASKDQPLKFDWSQLGWIQDSRYQRQLTPKTIDFSLNYSYNSPSFWKNRITVGFNVNTALQYNFLRFTDSKLDFGLGINLKIHRILDFSLSMKSTNTVLYLYSPSLVKKLNEGAVPADRIDPLNFFEDLFHSFGSIEQRKASNFNLNTISCKLTHHLGEWDLIFDYSGSPSTFNSSTGSTKNSASWKRSFSISVAWSAIDMIKTEIKVDKENKLTF